MAEIDDDQGYVLDLRQTIQRAFELSLRYLAVITDKDGNVARYGPFDSHGDAEEYTSQIFEVGGTERVEEMYEITTFMAHMNRWHDSKREQRLLNRLRAEAKSNAS